MESPLRDRLRISRAVATLIAIAVVLTKLWLIHSEEICGSATYHDAFWFVRSARDWYWGADYNWTAFVRPPAYPLWLAVTSAAGVPQRIAIDLLQMSGFALLALGLRRSGVSRVACLAGFAAACLHPGSFQLNNYTMADVFYSAVLPMTIGGLLLAMITRSKVAAVGCGMGLATLWFTREESVLIVLLLAAFCVISLLFARSKAEGWQTAAGRVFVPSLVVVATLAAFILTVYSVNRRTFRAFAKSEMSGPSYSAALDALIRIEPRQPQRFVPVTSESLELAFAVSPTFARLKPYYEGDVGTGWRTETFNQQGVRGEIGINYLMWALRNAAAEAGIHADAKKAEKFYNRMAREINAACDDGRLPARVVWASFIGPNLLPNLHRLPRSFSEMLGVFVLRYEIAPLQDDEILLPEERALYDRIARRRPLGSVGPAAAPVATAVKNLIGASHRFFVIALAVAAASCAVLLVRSSRNGDGHLAKAAAAALVLIACAILSRVALFTVIDATSWPVAYERFLYPVMPMASAFLIAFIGAAAQSLRGRKSGG